MPEGGFLQEKPKSPGSLAVVIALHASAITALMLAKTEYERTRIDPTVVWTIPEPKDPPPVPEPQPKREASNPKTEIVYVPPKIETRPQDDVVIGKQMEVPLDFTPGPSGNGAEPKADPAPLPAPLPPPPVPDPLRTEARLDARSELQPPYPPSEQRAQNEGSVTVRILIGPDGRVKQVDKVKATSDAFFRATEQQALRHWRFKPATLDGKPVESRTTMTVRFRLTD